MFSGLYEGMAISALGESVGTATRWPGMGATQLEGQGGRMSTQTKGKHTEGPWHLNTSIRSNLYVETNNARMPFICDMQLSVASEDDKDEIEANARLIAAAPELLDIVRRIESIYVYVDSITAGDAGMNTRAKRMLRDCREVLAKAEGTR